ncbi:MAG TPA: polysaccharide pyruvyl transferase family protein [Phenylobacterium sp.]
MAASREISIGLLWHGRGSGNLGIGALTVGNLIAARAAAEALGLTPRFTLFEFANDFDPPYVAGPDIDWFEMTTRSLLSPAGYAARIGRMDCVLDIGAGDSFTDIYSSKRFGFLFLSKAMAILRGVPLLLSPQTIGPFTRQPHKALAAWAMRHAKAVVARDPQSFAAIGEMAPDARRVEAIDVAFRLPYTRPERAPGGPLEIGVNVSGLLFNGGYTGANEFGLQVDYAGLMRGFIAAMAARPNTRVHLICHVTGGLPMDDDGLVADRLAAEFPGAVRVPNFASPSEAKSYISGMDFLVAGRMHACIAAYSSGVPVVPVAYSRKFSGLFQGVLGYDYGVPVSGLSTEAALEYLLKSVDERARVADAVAAGQGVVGAALDAYDAELRRLFQGVTQRSAA